MSVNSLGQQQYFNPLNWAFSKAGEAILTVNDSIAKIFGFKSGMALAATTVALSAGVYIGAETLSGPIAETIGVTQASVTSAQKTGATVGIVAGVGDIAINGAARSLAGKNYRA